jgi:hypothetical protein
MQTHKLAGQPQFQQTARNKRENSTKMMPSSDQLNRGRSSMKRNGEAKHFATVVQARRRQLNLTMAGLHANGGPTVPTLVRTEQGDLLSPRPDTLAKFDRGLKWEPGAAARAYWEGRPPHPVKSGSPFIVGEPTMPLSVEKLLSLMAVQRELHTLTQGQDPVPVPTLQAVVDRLNTEVSSIVGLFVTDLLERNRGEESVHPSFGVVLENALSTPVDPSDPEAEEKLYRRWLMNWTDGIDDTSKERFALRYARKQREGNQ